MANRKITLKDSTGTDNLYPATFTSQVFNEDGDNVDTLITDLSDDVGDLSNLTTADKTNLVSAISEVNNTNQSTVITPTSTAKYIRGRYTVSSTSSVLARIQDFINQISTGGSDVSFDVLLQGGGIFKLYGLIYADKSYGAGIILSVFGDCSYWQRNNGTDTIVSIK